MLCKWDKAIINGLLDKAIKDSEDALDYAKNFKGTEIQMGMAEAIIKNTPSIIAGYQIVKQRVKELENG